MIPSKLLKLWSNQDRNSDNNSKTDEYSSDKLKNKSYWGLCELIAERLIFTFRFVVYRNGLLYAGIVLTVTFSFGIATKLFHEVRTPHITFKFKLLTTFETHSQRGRQRQLISTYYGPDIILLLPPYSSIAACKLVGCWFSSHLYTYSSAQYRCAIT